MEREIDDQLQLPLDLTEPVPAPRWAEAIMLEIEGNQDTGSWDV